jgi:hypothetical protein
MNIIFEQLQAAQPQLFSKADISISAAMRDEIAELIGAIESVIALPAYQTWALAQAPAIAREHGCRCAACFSATTSI